MYPDRLVQPAHEVSQDHPVAMASTDYPVIPALEAALVHLVVLVAPDYREPKDLLVIRETRETADLQVLE